MTSKIYKLLRTCIFSVILCISLTPHAQGSKSTSKSLYDRFTPQQLDNLHFAYQFGEQFDKMGMYKEPLTAYNRYDNKGLGHIMAAIAWQETSAIDDLPTKKGHHAYGLFQNYIKTVKSKHKQRGVVMDDQELINFISNREVSAVYAMDELSSWLKIRKGNIRLALASYNAGWNYKKGLGYADAVLAKAAHLKRMKTFVYND